MQKPPQFGRDQSIVRVCNVDQGCTKIALHPRGPCMKRIEPTIEEKCRQCGHVNNISGEIFDTVLCSQCGHSLEHEKEFTYYDNCPLCDTSFNEGKPYVFYVGEDQVTEWICSNCQHSPRGLFYTTYEIRNAEKSPPRCCLCNAQAKLLVFTRRNQDGEPLCHNCITSKKGLKILKQHEEPLYIPGVREWFYRLHWKLQRMIER